MMLFRTWLITSSPFNMILSYAYELFTNPLHRNNHGQFSVKQSPQPVCGEIYRQVLLQMVIHLKGWKTCLRQTVGENGEIWFCLPYFRDRHRPIWIHPAHIDYLFSTLPLDFAIGGMLYPLLNPISHQPERVVPEAFAKNSFKNWYHGDIYPFNTWPSPWKQLDSNN